MNQSCQSGAICSLLTSIRQRDTLHTLTFRDPWGTLVALGAKRIETRSWSTPHRGPLAIHIAKTLPPEAKAWCDEAPFRQALEAGGYSFQPERAHNPWRLPLGHLVQPDHGDEVAEWQPPARFWVEIQAEHDRAREAVQQ